MSSLTKIVGQALDANLRYFALASKLANSVAGATFTTSSGTAGRMIAAPGTNPQQKRLAPPQAQAARSAILLEGAAGSKPAAMFLLENHLPHEVSATVEITPMVSPSGRKLKSTLQFDKKKIVLASGQQVVARISAPISTKFIVGERYTGEIRVKGIPGASIPLVLRRLADPQRARRSRRLAAPGSTGKTTSSRPRARATQKAAPRT